MTFSVVFRRIQNSYIQREIINLIKKKSKYVCLFVERHFKYLVRFYSCCNVSIQYDDYQKCYTDFYKSNHIKI